MSRKIHLALAPLGVGGPGQDGLWKDARIANNASIDINYYIELVKLAERQLRAPTINRNGAKPLKV